MPSLNLKSAATSLSGYVGERTVRFTDSSNEAWAYVDSHYDDDELDVLHIAIGCVVRDSDGEPFITYEYS